MQTSLCFFRPFHSVSPKPRTPKPIKLQTPKTFSGYALLRHRSIWLFSSSEAKQIGIQINLLEANRQPNKAKQSGFDHGYSQRQPCVRQGADMARLKSGAGNPTVAEPLNFLKSGGNHRIWLKFAWDTSIFSAKPQFVEIRSETVKLDRKLAEICPETLNLLSFGMKRSHSPNNLLELWSEAI